LVLSKNNRIGMAMINQFLKFTSIAMLAFLMSGCDPATLRGVQQGLNEFNADQQAQQQADEMAARNRRQIEYEALRSVRSSNGRTGESSDYDNPCKHPHTGTCVIQK
jgi:hypothetical protein